MCVWVGAYLQCALMDRTRRQRKGMGRKGACSVSGSYTHASPLTHDHARVWRHSCTRVAFPWPAALRRGAHKRRRSTGIGIVGRASTDIPEAENRTAARQCQRSLATQYCIFRLTEYSFLRSIAFLGKWNTAFHAVLHFRVIAIQLSTRYCNFESLGFSARDSACHAVLHFW